jgi:hypothetical protein
MDKVQKPSSNECYTSSSESFRIYLISKPLWMLWRGEQSHTSGRSRALESLVFHSLAQSLYWQLPCLTCLTVFMWCSTHLAIFLLSGLTFVRWFHYTDIFCRFNCSWVQSGRLMMAQSQKVCTDPLWYLCQKGYKTEGNYRSCKVKLSLCLMNYALCHEGIWGSGCIAPHFLDLGTSWRWMVSFTSHPLYPWGKSFQYPLDRRLGGPRELVWTTSRRENSWPYCDLNSNLPFSINGMGHTCPMSWPPCDLLCILFYFWISPLAVLCFRWCAMQWDVYTITWLLEVESQVMTSLS